MRLALSLTSMSLSETSCQIQGLTHCWVSSSFLLKCFAPWIFPRQRWKRLNLSSHQIQEHSRMTCIHIGMADPCPIQCSGRRTWLPSSRIKLNLMPKVLTRTLTDCALIQTLQSPDMPFRGIRWRQIEGGVGIAWMIYLENNWDGGMWSDLIKYRKLSQN